jgi:hypothetical protein
MYKDFKDLLSSFHAHGVKYLIVGGYAVSFHGQPRATKDIDLFVRADPTNPRMMNRFRRRRGSKCLGDFFIGEHCFEQSLQVRIPDRRDPAHAKAVYTALAAFGAPIADIRVDDLADPLQFVRFGREPLAVDIMPGIDGVDFDAAWERRVEGVIDAESGLMGLFISKEDLIASKLAAGRLRDLADVEEIRESEESQAAKKATAKPSVPNESSQ